MPRQARLDAADVLHHVMIRGVARTEIFLGNDDRIDFLNRMSRLLPETDMACYAWTLMTNHAHILLRTGAIRLSTFMARLLTGYASGFNRRHKRVGHLFQNRYHSIICQEEPYLRELLRYIHLNPLRSSLVPDYDALNSFPWSGHSVILGRQKNTWQDVGYILGLFSKDNRQARIAYSEFVRSGIDRDRRPEFAGGDVIEGIQAGRSLQNEPAKGDERILGDASFIADVLAHGKEPKAPRYQMDQSGINLDTIEKNICQIYEISERELYARGRHKKLVEARSLFCFLAVVQLNTKLVDLARRFGISGQAIGPAVTRGKRIAMMKGLKVV